MFAAIFKMFSEKVQETTASVSDKGFHATGKEGAMKMMVSDEAISALTGSGGRTSGVTETMKSVLTLPWGKTSKHTRARLDDSGSMSNVDDEAHPKSIFTCINQSGKAEVTARRGGAKLAPLEAAVGVRRRLNYSIEKDE